MLLQGHPLKRLMIRRTEGCDAAQWPQHRMSSFGASLDVHPFNAWHAGVQVPPLHAASAEMAACMCITAEKIQTGKLCYWQLVTVRGKNNHTASQKKKKERLFLQKILKLNPLFSFKWTRTFRQHSPSFLPKRDLKKVL